LGAAACGMLDLSDCSARTNPSCAQLQGFEAARLVLSIARRQDEIERSVDAESSPKKP
jgi:hypothetical protein